MHTPAHKSFNRDDLEPFKSDAYPFDFEVKPIVEELSLPAIESGPDRTPRGSMVEGFPIEPYEDVIFVEQQIEEKTASGLILAGEFKKLPGGFAAAVGPGRWFHPPMDASGTKSGAVFVKTQTKVGDWVIFGRYQSGGEPLELDGKRYLLCREGDLAGRSVSGASVNVRIAID